MKNLIVVRKAQEEDRSFIFGLSSNLAEVAQLEWHSNDVVQSMQDSYISNMLTETTVPTATFIAQSNNIQLGFIHVRTRIDEISGEISGTVPLLAVSPSAQGGGVGKILIGYAENWAKDLGCRLLHLEVFANNNNAKSFYQNLGFQPETIHMIKQM